MFKPSLSTACIGPVSAYGYRVMVFSVICSSYDVADRGSPDALKPVLLGSHN